MNRAPPRRGLAGTTGPTQATDRGSVIPPALPSASRPGESGKSAPQTAFASGLSSTRRRFSSPPDLDGPMRDHKGVCCHMRNSTQPRPSPDPNQARSPGRAGCPQTIYLLKRNVTIWNGRRPTRAAPSAASTSASRCARARSCRLTSAICVTAKLAVIVAEVRIPCDS